jgi:hypothetical protein
VGCQAVKGDEWGTSGGFPRLTFDPRFLARAPITLLSNVTSSALHTERLPHIPALLALLRCNSGYVPLVVLYTHISGVNGAIKEALCVPACAERFGFATVTRFASNLRYGITLLIPSSFWLATPIRSRVSNCSWVYEYPSCPHLLGIDLIQHGELEQQAGSRFRTSYRTAPV